MRKTLRSLALAVALWSAGPGVPSASATTALYLTEIDHATLSTAVIRGTVVSQETDRDPRFGRIRTRSTVRVSSVLLGQAPTLLTINQMGGQLGDEVLTLPGDAELNPGEDVVLFVNEQGGDWFLTALAQSEYHVIPSLDGPLLERTLGDSLFLRSDGGGLTPWVDTAPGQPMTLARLQWIFADAGLAPPPVDMLDPVEVRQ